MNIITALLIGIALSMDAFSLLVSMSAYNIKKKRLVLCLIIIPVCHFFLPLIGSLIGNIIPFNFDKFRIIIFLFIFTQMIIDYYDDSPKVIIDSILSILLLCLSVSIDSFTVGMSYRINLNSIITFVIISITSFLFCFLGIKLGKVMYQKFDKYAKLIGVFIMYIILICQVLSL